MEKGFVYMDQAVEGILWDAKYSGSDNFTGKPVDGYCVNRVVCTERLAKNLSRARKRANELGYEMLVWDCYRPCRAVLSFLRWVALPEDGATKLRHYPNIDKTDIVSMGYVASRSSHSRGSAVDLTLVGLTDGVKIDMGGDFDLMDVSSAHEYLGLSAAAAENRALLRDIMLSNGFADYGREWWHYSLIDEPYPNTYFDFPIE